MKIGFVSLGCPKNLVDSEVMIGLSQRAGHELTTDQAEADVLIVNTCAFIDAAKQESINAILEMAELKKTGSCKRLVVTGCLGERYREELQTQIPEVDAVLGTGDVPGIVGAIEGRPSAAGVIPLRLVPTESRPSTLRPFDTLRVVPSKVEGRRAEERTLPTYLYDADTPRTLATPRHYAYVKVAEGCDYKCAFCIIPTLRGQYRSRAPEEIVREARQLAARGVRELILISQDTTFYGRDRDGRSSLAPLLRELNRVDGLEWVRLLYLYPTTITDDILDAIAASDKVCKYIDLPLQHAADDVLRRMKRPGNRRQYERLLARIRARVPGVSLRTTFIVGFPGETDVEFDDLCSFLQAVEFDHVGVFTYSHEEGTSAFGLPDDVPAATKRSRRNRLMAIQKKIVARAQRRRIGQRVRVLVDGPAPDHELVLRGRVAGQAPGIDPLVYLTEADPELYQPGTFLDAIVVGARGYDLIVRPAAELPTGRDMERGQTSNFAGFRGL